jgi:hypothetical protein
MSDAGWLTVEALGVSLTRGQALFTVGLAVALVAMSLRRRTVLQEREGKRDRGGKRQQQAGEKKQDSWADHVLPHDAALTEVVEGELWVLQGTLPPPMTLPRAMTIFRPSRGTGDELWVHSPIAVSEELLVEILKLGRVKYIVIPSAFHTLDARVWSDCFPDAVVVAPEVHRAAAERAVGRDIEGSCQELLLEWTPIGDDRPFVIPIQLPGVKELAYELPLAGAGGLSALVVCDTFFNIEQKLNSFVADTLLGSTGFFGVTRLGRLMLWWSGERTEFVAAVLRLSQTKAWAAIVMAHGTPVVGAGICNAKLKSVVAALS